MNFLELINKCLLELNYKQVNAISELVKNDHKRIMSILNVINKEICNVEPWNFLIRKTTLALPKGKTEIDNPVSGRIWYLIISGEKYKYSPESLCNPIFRATPAPSFFLLIRIKRLSFCAYSLIIESELSVEPSFTQIISMSCNV